jgi:hypothetical protein
MEHPASRVNLNVNHMGDYDVSMKIHQLQQIYLSGMGYCKRKTMGVGKEYRGNLLSSAKFAVNIELL